MPDIIITDIVMPKKSGIELIKEIKASTLLNHIPIIVVSAKNSSEDIIEGLNSGANNYLTKPFQPEELKIRVKNLITARNLLIEKYRRTVLKDEKDAEILEDGNANAEFLRLTTDIIYREMKNPDFTPTMLSEELAISMSQLNKKLNAITGYPTSTYILQVKLSNAKKLLSNENKTIGEIAAECGIYDVNYFSRVFKRHTGFTPTQYKKLPKTRDLKHIS
jgi:YesN/AraC family two-component response regulator